ncbi:MAG: 30S ribosome-binding factor RbfA [Alphaproteobacteria bacterium]|nr:30S ribosome-binding factor RbfA [Alphaproteobacteria bacterium]MCD8570538.1 30S ribosome-binding factor RbfA [Alphaproteobacteria bacterium]
MHKPPSQRQLRVGEQLKHILSETMARGHFQSPILLDAGKVTVTEVRASPDLRNATAYVLPLGGVDTEEVLAALNAEAKIFQKEIGRQGNLKFTPRIYFKADDVFGEAHRIEDLLRNITYSDQEDDEQEA